MSQQSGTLRGEFPAPAVLRAKDEVADYESLTPEQRGKLLVLACRAAAVLERSRVKNGLPPSEPAPWPPSTWEFLRKQTAHARRENSADRN